MADLDPLEPPVHENPLMNQPPKTASSSKQEDVAELMRRIGHTFHEPRLLQAALTHPSLAGTSRQRRKGGAPYERLEFLGDRVLGLVIAEWLYQHYPEADEGDLAKRHAALVNRDALRQVAIEIGLSSFIRVARGENVTAARKNLATLSDALEALIGALYLDGGLLGASAFIHRYWQKDIAIAEAPADPKTALQEWAQAQALPLPQYKVVEHSGPAHAPRFVIEVSLKGHPPMTADGDSKRAAQKAAAAALLAHVQGITTKTASAGGKP